MKSSLIDDIGIFLLRQNYLVKTLSRGAFDILAREGSRIILLKVLEDANSISVEYAEQMRNVAAYIKATPIIVSVKSGQNKLENNVVYERFGIYTLNTDTFMNCIRNKFPFFKSDHAGLTAHISSKNLKKMLQEMEISLNLVARKVGVSRKMIERYIKGDSEITMQKAFKLYDVFGGKVFEKIDVFNAGKKGRFEADSEISVKYKDIGFDAIDTSKVPFDVIAKKDKAMILTEVGDKASPHTRSLGKILDADNLVIYKRKKPKDVAAISKREFMEFEEANELLKFLKEFG